MFQCFYYNGEVGGVDGTQFKMHSAVHALQDTSSSFFCFFFFTASRCSGSRFASDNKTMIDVREVKKGVRVAKCQSVSSETGSEGGVAGKRASLRQAMMDDMETLDVG